MEILGLSIIWLTVTGLTYTVPVLNRPEPVIPVGIPPELATLPLAQLDGLSEDGLVVYNGSSPIQVRIKCSNVTTCGGYWFGFDAGMQIAGRSGEIEGLPKYTTKSWSSSIRGNILGDEVAPEFTALLPVTTDDVHNWIRIMAKMEINYPQSAGVTFIDSHATVTREVSLLVVSPEDIDLKNEIEKVQRENEGNLGYVGTGIAVSVLWIFLCAPLIVGLYKVYYARKYHQPL